MVKRYWEDLARYQVRVFGWDEQSISIELTRCEGRNRVDLMNTWHKVWVPISEDIIEEIQTILDADLGTYLRAKFGRTDPPKPELRLFVS